MYARGKQPRLLLLAPACVAHPDKRAGAPGLCSSGARSLLYEAAPGVAGELIAPQPKWCHLHFRAALEDANGGYGRTSSIQGCRGGCLLRIGGTGSPRAIPWLSTKVSVLAWPQAKVPSHPEAVGGAEVWLWGATAPLLHSGRAREGSTSKWGMKTPG